MSDFRNYYTDAHQVNGEPLNPQTCASNVNTEGHAKDAVSPFLDGRFENKQTINEVLIQNLDDESLQLGLSLRELNARSFDELKVEDEQAITQDVGPDRERREHNSSGKKNGLIKKYKEKVSSV